MDSSTHGSGWKWGNWSFSKAGTEIIPHRNEYSTKLRGKNVGMKRENEEGRGRHLYHIQNQVGGERGNFDSRREDKVITRLRLVHTALNDSLYRMNKHESGNCRLCGSAGTVEHGLIYLYCLWKRKSISVGRIKRNGDKKSYT